MRCTFLLSLFTIASAASCEDGSCAADGEDIALMQVKGSGKHSPTPATSPLPHVACPGSGNMCDPNEKDPIQCCPGVAGNDDLTFPCPGSAATPGDCETDTVYEEPTTTEPVAVPYGSLVEENSEVAWGGPTGGISNGMYQNGFDWKALMKMKGPKCNEVCKGEHDQCYPIKRNGFMGPPCGVLSAGPHSRQGCFQNGPTQTCALCDINVKSTEPGGVHYCCPTANIKRCRRQRPGLAQEEANIAHPHDVACPGSGNMCDPTIKGPVQCCPGYAGSNDKTFPCPGSESTPEDCQTDVQPTTTATTTAASLVEENSEVVQGGPKGGLSHGMYQNDFDWKALMKMKGPKCNEVCKGEHDQCYPIKSNGYLGPPCGVLSAGPDSRQGCFQNGPTQTCALCDIKVKSKAGWEGVHYCCPTAQIKRCKKQR